MTPVNPCLSHLVISYNIFFVVVGGLVIVVYLALLSPSLDDLHGGNDLEVQTTSHIVLYIGGSVTMVIAILGAYGAHKKKVMALTVYLVCVLIGVGLMLRAGVLAAVARPKLVSLVEERWRSFLPLDQASDDIRNQAEALQTSLHCCGLFSHEDWEGNIPKSCLCNLEEETKGQCQTVSYRNFLLNLFWQKKSVLRQNCFPIILDSVTTHANITLIVVFTLLVLAIFGLVFSSLMIYQMFNTSNRPNTPLSVPVMFIDHPPAYQQLYNLTEPFSFSPPSSDSIHRRRKSPYRTSLPPPPRSLFTGSPALPPAGLLSLKSSPPACPPLTLFCCCSLISSELQTHFVFSSLNMTQRVNPCLKGVFTIFNVFFAFIGGVIIALALLSQVFTNINGGENLEGRIAGLIILYVVGSVTMVIAILGAYGAHKESKVSLIVFLVCMVIGSMMMLRAGIPAATIRPELEGKLEDKFRELLPLDQASDEVKNMAETLQAKLHCCGLFSYEDWEGNTPPSCDCDPEAMLGKCQTVSYKLLMLRNTKSVYVKTCLPIVIHYLLLLADIVIGVVFTLAVLALLGMILSSVIIHQMRYPNRPTVLLTVPTIFTPSPPKYQELKNPPAY
ncbi:uncharacterized protein [Enoplosus armatus]|uniref:uncharacterized protein n=1 Tax=Enoplosus armatus TaxID=215367 RepID=UPI0039948061